MDAQADIKGQEAQGRQSKGNEGQKMVWHMQDLDEHIDATKIEAVELLPGIDINDDMTKKRQERRLFRPDGGMVNVDEDFDPTEKFKENENNAR